jgi:D-alanyl-D-alanine carboxypeptidase/D-alanyl-D-alanine-endopeptidase (penicillin-binding protein 4)
MQVTRRALLAGAAAWLAAPARAAVEAEPLAAILERSGLSELSGFALVDMDGRLVEGHRAEVGLPPASVAKIVTALYALEVLGPRYRFRTQLRGTGPVAAGVLRGDLVLEGGGDPVLDTDALGALAQALAAGGLTRVAGRFGVADGALPAVERIADDQPEGAGYNAAVGGLNLNFNRVQLSWAPGAAGPALAFAAPGRRFGAVVGGVRAELVDGGLPRRRVQGGEVWTLPRRWFRGEGSVWLPVRAPAAHAGEVFRSLALGAGVRLPEPERLPAAGGVLALHDSPELAGLLRGMLRYSTNLTAEAIGMRAGQARGAAISGLADSAAAMTAWARTRFGVSQAEFANHSGLTDRSRIPAAEMARVLARAEGLEPLLRARPILGVDRRPVETGAQAVSKTGTLNFVCGLAGYLAGERRLAFAIFAADPERRSKVRPEERDDPPGGEAWLARARGQEQALLRRWAALYA